MKKLLFSIILILFIVKIEVKKEEVGSLNSTLNPNSTNIKPINKEINEVNNSDKLNNTNSTINIKRNNSKNNSSIGEMVDSFFDSLINTTIPKRAFNSSKVEKKEIKKDNKNETKDFDLSDLLVNFFKDILDTTFSNNSTNSSINNQTKSQRVIEREKLKEKQIQSKIRENKKKFEQSEKINNNIYDNYKISSQKQKEKQIQKEKEEFEKNFSQFKSKDIISFILPKRDGEFLYLNITSRSLIKVGFVLSNSEKIIHLRLLGPNNDKDKAKTITLHSAVNKNFYYFEQYCPFTGEYSFYLNNFMNKEDTEIIFAIKTRENISFDEGNFNKSNEDLDENLGLKKVDKISKLLENIGNNVDQLRIKQNLVNKKTETHNENITKRNKKIVFYAIIEVGTMILIFVLQTIYIKKIIEKC